MRFVYNRTPQKRPYRDGLVESARVYIFAVFDGWAGQVGVVTAVLAVIFGLTHYLEPALWIWATIAIGGFVLAQFLAFHDEREKGSELGGALYLVGINWAVQTDPKGASLQPTLIFRNTLHRQVRYELLQHALVIGGVTDTGALSNSGGFVGPGQDSLFRFPPLQGLPLAQVYEGTMFYRFVYSSPRIKRYEHRTSRNLTFSVEANAASSQYTFVGDGEEETIRR